MKSKKLMVVWALVIVAFIATFSLSDASGGNPFNLINKKLNKIISLLQEEVIPQLGCEPVIGVPKTGQTTSYAEGDDGYLRTGYPWPNPRFLDNGDGTITDLLTGLMWMKDASRNCFEWLTWEDALSKIDELNTNPENFRCREYTAGHNDWRMPNLNELKSLVHYGYHLLALPDTAGTGQWVSGDPFLDVHVQHWTSTTAANDSRAAWTVNFTRGQGVPWDKTYNDRVSVWPVRGGN